MKSDMTYVLVDYEKANVHNFLCRIDEYSKKENIILEDSDKNFFAMIAKHIIFLKYFVLSFEKRSKEKYVNIIISDLYFLVISLIKMEERYVYVNCRSIIENSIRMFTGVSVKEKLFTKDVFEEIRENIGVNDYSLLRSEYRVACNYIHGGDLLEDNLAFVLDECFEDSKMSQKEKNAFYTRMCKLIKIFDREMIKHYTERINGCFHRKKSLMRYLIGEENVDLLFEILS